jgi:MoxR-like ATPase
LDERRVIDVPGYERLKLHEATRFIGTMNYGYSGTKPLNEALVSRFVLPDVREMNLTELVQLLSRKFNNAKKDMLKLYAGIFEDLQKKAQSGEISTACVDLRGIQDALAMTEIGMNPNEALQIAVTNKAFEAFERTIVRDTVSTRIPASFTAEDVFGSTKAFVVDFSK